MRACLDLLVKHNYIDGNNKTLKQIYEATIGVYKLERDAPEMWEMLHNHKIGSLFQMEEQSGIKGIATAKPNSLEDLAALNSVIRLMAPEKGAEQPIDKFSRFKKNPELWYKEMDNYGVSKEGQKVLEKIVGISYGLCIQQEQFMMLVQQPELGGFSLLWADKLRKAVAKKNPKDFEELEKEFFRVTEEKGCEKKLCEYTWHVLVECNKG